MNPLEGRTTLATNLAVAMAQSGMRVLLVDGNGRSPQLHQIFNLNNDFGLFDILHGRTAERRVTHRTKVENVDVLTAGAVAGNTVDLLNTELLVDVLGEFSDQYDRVIVDSPALGARRGSPDIGRQLCRCDFGDCGPADLPPAVGYGLGMRAQRGHECFGDWSSTNLVPSTRAKPPKWVHLRSATRHPWISHAHFETLWRRGLRTEAGVR